MGARTFTASRSGLRGWDPLTLPPGPGERRVPAKTLLPTGLRGSISPPSAKRAVRCSRPTLLPLGWTAGPLSPQLGWLRTSRSPGGPEDVVGAGAPGSSWRYCFLWPHTPRWPHSAGEGRAQGSPPRGHPVAGCWLRWSRPAASGSSLKQESLLGSDPEGTRGPGSRAGSTQQENGKDQVGV